MAHRKYDLVQETSTSTGTGAMALGGAVTRRRAFSAVLSNADTAYVLIEHGSAAEWEICLATYATSGNQLTRGAVVASSTGSAVSFSAGTKTISLIAPASKMVVEDNNGDASITRNFSVGGTMTYGGVTMSAAISGSPGAFVSSNSPTISGTLTVAAITQTGAHNFSTAAGAPATMGMWNSGGTQLGLRGGSGGYLFYNGSATLLTVDNSGNITMAASTTLATGTTQPIADNTYSCGAGSYRWSTVYAATGTINTSDGGLKVDMRSATAAERRAAKRILDKGPVFYRFTESVAEKGDAARIHVGYVAQDVRDALEAEGLDPWRYGFMCADEITAMEEYTVTVERPKVHKVEVSEQTVEIVDGRPTLVTKIVEREEPVGRMVPVVDGAGNVVMRPVADQQGERMEPMLHFVPELETVEEARTREVPTGETRLGLRYSELEAFLKCAV